MVFNVFSHLSSSLSHIVLIHVKSSLISANQSELTVAGEVRVRPETVVVALDVLIPITVFETSPIVTVVKYDRTEQERRSNQPSYNGVIRSRKLWARQFYKKRNHPINI